MVFLHLKFAWGNLNELSKSLNPTEKTHKKRKRKEKNSHHYKYAIFCYIELSILHESYKESLVGNNQKINTYPFLILNALYVQVIQKVMNPYDEVHWEEQETEKIKIYFVSKCK